VLASFLETFGYGGFWPDSGRGFYWALVVWRNKTDPTSCQTHVRAFLTQPCMVFWKSIPGSCTSPTPQAWPATVREVGRLRQQSFWDKLDERASEQESAYKADQQAAKKAGKGKFGSSTAQPRSGMRPRGRCKLTWLHD